MPLLDRQYLCPSPRLLPAIIVLALIMLQMTEVRLTFSVRAERPSLPAFFFFLMKQLCEISPCVNTNEDPPAQLKSQPVVEEET